MDLLSCCPFWPIKDGLPASYPTLTSDVTCEVAVIGAGITGALVAWHLTEAGIDTVVVDRRDVGQGSTAGSTSLLQYEIDIPLRRLARRVGLDHAERAYRGSRRAIAEISRLVKTLRLDCGFSFKGSLQLASKVAHVAGLKKEFEARRSAGFQVDWWSQRELARHSDLSQPAAILSRSPQAAQMDAFAFTHGLLAAAVRRGARVFDRTTVRRLPARGRRVKLRTDRGVHINACWLVVASGYEADQFLPESVTKLDSTFAMISEPLAEFPGWPSGLPVIWETADPYIYLRTTPEGRIIMGGYDEEFRDPVRRDRLLNAKVSALRRRFKQLFPRIAFEVAYAWAGTFGKTADGLPFIGEHRGVPHTWFALGYGGNGITYSLIAAQLFRDRLLGRPTPDLALYAFDRQPDPKP